MRIGIDLSFIRPDHKNGGTEAVIRNFIKAYLETGRDILQEDEFLFFIHRDIYADYKKEFPTLSYLVYDNKGPHAVRTIWFQTFALPGLVRKKRLDLLFFPTFQTGLSNSFCVPVAVNPHDIQYQYYPEYFSRLKRAYYRIFYGNALRKADRVIAISRYVQGSYETYFKKAVRSKMTLIYDPIDFQTEKQQETEALKDFAGDYILSINSLAKHKNLMTLIKAFDLLLHEPAYAQRIKACNLKLVMCGCKNNGVGEIEEYIAGHNLQERIILTGFVNDAQLNYLYQHARVFVTPSLYEGFGMTPVEAMAAGCPVISTKETSLEEVTLGRVQYYEPATDARALCRALQQELWEAPVKKEELEARKQAVSCYDKQVIFRQYLSLFHSMAGVRKAGAEPEKAVYGRLFDVVRKELGKSQNPPDCSKAAFMAAVGSASKRIDVGAFAHLKGEDFLEAVYMACFQRLPDEAERKKYGAAGRKEILKAAALQPAFGVRRLQFVNHPYGKITGGFSGMLFRAAACVKNSVWLRRVAKLMPSGIQKKIRSIFC